MIIAEIELMRGDCVEKLDNIGDNTIDLVVTSPPYDNLRKYNGEESQLNYEKFKIIATKLYDKVKQGGVVVWVVGDATIKGSESGTSFKQALFFKECGFNLHDTMIYAKKNPIPQNHNRYEQSFEYMFVFSKGKPNTFNPIQIDTKNGGAVCDWGNRKTIADNQQCRRHRDTDLRETKSKKNKYNIWYYSIGGGKTGHPAVFPLKLAEDHIESWSNNGDIVLDPFMGSGTTGVACKNLNRNFIGIELNEEYFEIARERIESA